MVEVLSTANIGKKESLPNTVISHCSIKATGFLPSLFSGMPIALTLFCLKQFSMSSRRAACLAVRLVDNVPHAALAPIRPLRYSGALPVPSRSFCMCWRRNVISTLIPLTYTASSVMKELRVVTVIRISLSVGSGTSRHWAWSDGQPY